MLAGVDIKTLRAKYRALAPTLTERSRRIWAATEARALGRGGIGVGRAGDAAFRARRSAGAARARVGRCAGSRSGPAPGRGTEADDGRIQGCWRIWKGWWSQRPRAIRCRRCAGRRRACATWRRSCRRWAMRSATLVAELFTNSGYSLQANRKTREGRQHPDRDAQFRYINDRSAGSRTRGSRRSPWTPRRRNWWATSRTPAGEWRPEGQPGAGAGARLPDPRAGQGHSLRGL